MERALACWPWPQLLRRTGAPTRESPHQVSGWPSLPERLCKRKATPSFGLGSVLWDMPKDRRRDLLSKVVISPGPERRQQNAVRKENLEAHFFGGEQGPILVQSFRVGRVAGAYIERNGRNHTKPMSESSVPQSPGSKIHIFRV